MRSTFLALLTSALGAWQGPSNLDFKQGTVGAPPPGWTLTTPQGYTLAVSDQCGSPVTRCAVLRSTTQGGAPNGIVLQNFEAAPWRKKEVRFRARVRIEASGMMRAQLWMRVDRAGGRPGFFDNMADRPITANAWSEYEIRGQVASDAERIFIGAMLFGQGAVWLADVSVESVGEFIEAAEPPRPLNGRGIDNLRAFAKLYGYIRYFYPGDEAASADWNALAYDGVRAAELAQSADELASTLESFFRPIAPAVRVFPTSAPRAAPDLKPPEGAKPVMTSWRHHGLGTSGSTMGVYRSWREKQDAPGGESPAPFRAALGGGVEAIVPTTLFVDDKGALPRGESYTARRVMYNGNDRTTRLAGIVIAWNIFEHFYPYFDVAGTDWNAEFEKALRRAATDQDETAFAMTLKLLVAALHDGHGNVMGGEPAALPLPLRLVWAGNRVVVAVSADPSGQVKPGDAVISVDGTPALLALTQLENTISGATPQWIRAKALGLLGAGPPNSSATLEVESFSNPGERRMVRLARTQRPPEEKRPEKIAEIKPGIWYVDLTRIVDADWTAALPNLEKASGIVFDLRGYPRVNPNWLTHLSETPLKSAQWHIPVIAKPDRVDMTFQRGGEWNLQPSKPLLKAKRAVMTDGRAISYAESTMGIVEHYKLAEIVGGPTAGTNGNVNPITLPGGYQISWTGMKVLKHDGSRHHGVGIKPTIPVEPTRAGIAAGRDEVLERAIAAVS